jgi:hypothetical protein
VTPTEFLQELASPECRALGWAYGTGTFSKHWIRARLEEKLVCPITAITYLKTSKLFPIVEFHLAANEIHLDGYSLIMSAADHAITQNTTDPWSATRNEYRLKMLEALELGR